MSESHSETQKIQGQLCDVSREVIPSKSGAFKKSVARAQSLFDLVAFFSKEEESEMYALLSVPRSHSTPVLLPSHLRPSISRVKFSRELFSASVKDIQELESSVWQKVSKTSKREEKLAVLLNALSIRNRNLKNPIYTQGVLVAMKAVIQGCLTSASWKKIESYVEGLLEQAFLLSQTYQYHQGLLMVEVLFDFLLELHAFDECNLKTIEEKARKIEVFFNKRELFERLIRFFLPEPKAFIWEALISSLIEERSEDVESFEHLDQNIQDTVNYARKVIQDSAHIFLKYESALFLLKVEAVFLVLKESKFERDDIRKFINDLSDLNFSEKFHHIKDYAQSIEKLKPNPLWPQVIAGFEKAMRLCVPSAKKLMEQKKILKYLNQLVDSFDKYKKYPILMLDALQGLIQHRLFLIHLQKENTKIENKLHEVSWAFEKIEKIYFKMKGRDRTFLEGVQEGCLIFLQKDNLEEETEQFFAGLLERIHSKTRTAGLFFVEKCFEEIGHYKLLLKTLIPSIEWDVILLILKEKITKKYHDYEEIISFDQGIEPYLTQLLDCLKALESAFHKTGQDERAPSLRPFRLNVIYQLVDIHWFLNTEVLPEITRGSIAYQIKLSGVHAYVAKLTLVRKDIPWDRVIATLEEDIKSSCQAIGDNPLGKRNLDECIEQAITHLESLKVGLMPVENMKGVSFHPKYLTCIQVIGDFLVFRDSLHESGNQTSKLLNIELDKLSKMLQNDYRSIFLSSVQRANFLRCVEEISLKVLVQTCEDTDKTALFTAHLKHLYSAIDDRDLNPKSRRSIHYFLRSASQLLHFRTTLFSAEEGEKRLLSVQKIVKFLDVMGKMPIDYLTFKFLSDIEAELLPLLSVSNEDIVRAKDNIQKILLPKLANIRKNKLCKLLLPIGENNLCLKTLSKIIACELDKGSVKQDRESAELSSDPEDFEKREKAKVLIKQLQRQLEAIEKLRPHSREYAAQNLSFAQTALSILTLYTQNEERKAVLHVIENMLGGSLHICQSYELDVKILEKLRQSLFHFSLKTPLPTVKNLENFAVSMERELKEGLIRAICEKYKLTMSLLIQLEEAFLQPGNPLTLEEFSHKVQHKVKEILALKKKAIQAQYAIESTLQKIELAQKESLKISTKPPSLVSCSLNMKEEEYQSIKNRLISLNENRLKLQHIEMRLDLYKKKVELSRIKGSSLPVFVNEEDESHFFLEINSMAIKQTHGNVQKIDKAIDSLIKDIDSIIKAHPFLEDSPYFFVLFRQSDEDKELANHLEIFKTELKKLQKSTSILEEKMDCLGRKAQEMDEALSLFFSKTKKVSPRREKTLTHFQKILQGEALDVEDRKECQVSFCTDSKTIRAARRYTIVLLESKIAQLEKETKSLENTSEDALCEEGRRLAETISKETASIQSSISFSKLREKLRSECSSLETQRAQLQSKNALHADLKSLDDLNDDYFNVQLRLTRLKMVLGESTENGPIGSEVLHGIRETVEKQAREVLRAQDSRCFKGIIKNSEAQLKESIKKLLEAEMKAKAENRPSVFTEPVVGNPFNALGSPYFFCRDTRDKEAQFGGVLRSEKQGLGEFACMGSQNIGATPLIL